MGSKLKSKHINDAQEDLVRSLSMSNNVALSVVDEISHMMRMAPTSVECMENYNCYSLLRLPTLSSATYLRSQYWMDESNFSFNDVTQALSNSDNEHTTSGTSQSVKMDPPSTSLTKSQNMINLNKFSLAKTDVPNISTIRSERKNDLLEAVVITKWDNIVGPQCVYIWSEESTSVMYPTVLSNDLSPLVEYVIQHSVDHHAENMMHQDPSTERSTMCFVKDLNLVFLSMSIKLPVSSDVYWHPAHPCTISYSISILCKSTYLNEFFLLKPLLTQWLTEFSPKIGVFLLKPDMQTKYSSKINSWCAELCKTIIALRTNWVSENHRSSCKESLMQDSYILPSSRFRDCDSMSLPLTSHLISSCCSLVVSSCDTAMNETMRFLLKFSPKPERYCSRLSLPTLRNTYMKGLFVQGFTRDDIQHRNIGAFRIISNRTPISFLDLDKKKFRLMLPHHHLQKRSPLMEKELNELWRSGIFISPPMEAFPSTIKDGSAMVKNLMQDLSRLNPNNRNLRIMIFLRRIYVKCLAVLCYINDIQGDGLNEKDIKLKTKSLPDLLGLDDQDYLIVKAFLEKLRPGATDLTM